MRPHMPLMAMSEVSDIVDSFACLLCSDDVRTLLISGPSGTGKSVAARSITGICPDRELIEIPQGVTREQLFGSVDIEKAISTGKRVCMDSILGRADGNIIMVDDVNLLSEDVLMPLLNAVCEGAVRAELGGVSVDSALDCILIATMNPDEGTLDPHIMDRFDMYVTMGSVDDEDVRKRIVLNNLEYESDPIAFCRRYESDEAALRERIDSACVGGVSVSDEYLGFISKICKEMYVDGHRGDVSVLNVACALSALNGRSHAGLDELKEAARLCLQHRRREPPEDSPEPPEQQQEPDDDDETDEPRDRDGDGQHDDPSDQQSEPRDDHDGDDGTEQQPSEGGDTVFAIGDTFDVRDYVPPESRDNRNRKSGKRDMSRSTDRTGRAIGDRLPVGTPNDIALVASIRAAAPYQSIRDHDGMAVALRKEDLREKVRIRMKGTRLLFVVDGSGSVGAHDRMVAVKGAILSMLEDAYRRRDEVGLVIFKDSSAEEVLPMTRSVLTAYRHLQELPTGGHTPLIAGLRKGYEILSKEAEKGNEPVMVVLTDGRGNVGPDGGKQTPEQLQAVCDVLRDSGIRIIVVDTEVGLIRFGRSAVLSGLLDAEYTMLEDLDARTLSESIREAMRIFG